MNLHKVIIISFSVVLPLFFLLASYQAVLSFHPLTTIQEEVFQFMEGKNESAMAYTAAEISHLQDVAQVMQKVNLALYVLSIMLAGLLASSWKKKALMQKMLYSGGIITVAFLVILLLAMVISFNGLFTLFHQLFFPQGNWQFAADSFLIHAFPIPFFMNISLIIFGLTFMLGISVLFISLFMKPK